MVSLAVARAIRRDEIAAATTCRREPTRFRCVCPREMAGQRAPWRPAGLQCEAESLSAPVVCEGARHIRVRFIGGLIARVASSGVV